MFYKWRQRDFTTVWASELEEGDEISYHFGGDGKYGAIPIEHITRIRGEGIWLRYTLPPGAMAESSENSKIAIYSWEGERPKIQITQHINRNDQIFIRRK